MKTHAHCARSQYLPQLVEERLAENQREQMEQHLETCTACQHALETLVNADETADRVVTHLRHARPMTTKVLLDVMECVRSAPRGTEAGEPFRLDDFAVDYLRPSDNPDSIGRLGTYEISEVLGTGGMGIVLKGLDVSLNRVVAVKVLTPLLALNPSARKRFLREAQAAAAVAHPNVVTIHSVDEDRLPYLVMEFIDGPSLQERLDTEGFLQLNQILRIGIQVAAGLEAAHAQGLVHRDIKPGNILLENGIERVSLTDFGLARAADDASITRDGTVVGTPQFMSPEQARGEAVEQTSDLFSLGSVLYTLATGRPPFRAESSYGVMRKITDDSPTPIRELNPEMPDWLCAIIDKLMAKDKDQRFSSASELHRLLKGCLSHTQQPTVSALPEIPGMPRKSHSFPILGVLKGAFAMATLATGLLFVMGVLPLTQPANNSDEDTKSTSTKNDKGTQVGSALAGGNQQEKLFKKQFVAAFSNPGAIGTLDVDIKRGSILVTGYEGDKVIVDLTVPNYSRSDAQPAGGLKELRPNTLDFGIEESENRIKVDGNSYEYITNLHIQVPNRTDLILDSYRDGKIVVEKVSGHFNLRSQNNDIQLKEVSGSARLRAYNGSLAADFESVAKGKELYFKSYNGSIDLMLPDGIQADLRYRSGSGRVATDFDVAQSDELIQKTSAGQIEFDEFNYGTLNGGGPALTIETEKGDIRLRRRMELSIR